MKQLVCNTNGNELYQEFKVCLQRRGRWPTGFVCLAPLLALLVVPKLTAVALVTVLLICALLVTAALAREVVSESLTVLKGVGVVLTTNRRCFSSSSNFLDMQDIHSVIINETLTTTNIHVHLAFILHNSDRLALAFPNLRPGYGLLVPIYQEVEKLVPDDVGDNSR